MRSLIEAPIHSLLLQLFMRPRDPVFRLTHLQRAPAPVLADGPSQPRRVPPVASLPAFEDVSDSDLDVDSDSDGGRDSEGGGRTSLGHGDMDQYKYVDADGEDEDEEEDDVEDLLEEDAKASGVLPLICEAARTVLISSVAVVFVRVYVVCADLPP